MIFKICIRYYLCK